MLYLKMYTKMKVQVMHKFLILKLIMHTNITELGAKLMEQTQIVIVWDILKHKNKRRK